MKQLKTDYKDAMFDGARKYRISQNPDGTSKEDEKAIRKAAACVSYFETGNGTVTFTCIGKKPATDFQVVIKGV